VTGRGPGDTHLDPNLTVPVCHGCHELSHGDLRRAGVDEPLQGATVFERGARRLQRAAMWVARLAEFLGFAWMERFARSLRQWGTDLLRGVALLDAHVSGWRQIPGLA
jgi:hypothetical protein